MNLDDLKKSRKSHAADALELFVQMLDTSSNVLDIGAGSEEVHAKIMRDEGLIVDTCDFHDAATYRGDFNQLKFDRQYDGVWASHCLEHQLNVNAFLKKIQQVTTENGVVCITVPPLKHLIVGGHVSLWNAGLLVYNLVLAGFDCKDIKIKSYGYNISAIVRKKTFQMPELTYDSADLMILKEYFPSNLSWNRNKPKFEGVIAELNWNVI
jgi:SAM-dependent methyltransferase